MCRPGNASMIVGIIRHARESAEIPRKIAIGRVYPKRWGLRGLGYIPKCWDGKDLDDFKEKRPKKRPSDVEIPSVGKSLGLNVLSLREFDDGGGVSLDGGVRTKSREHLPEGCEG